MNTNNLQYTGYPTKCGTSAVPEKLV